MPWCSWTRQCLDVMPGRHRSGREEIGTSAGSYIAAGDVEADTRPVTRRDTGGRSSGTGCSWHELWPQTTELAAGSEEPQLICHGQSCRSAGAGCGREPGRSPVPAVGRGQREGEQWQPPCLSPGLPTQRRARALASPLPRSALQGQHTQSPRDEAGTGRDPLGSRAACSAPSLLPTTLSALLLSHALPTPAHPAPRKPSPAPRWQYGRCCKARLTPGGNSRRSTGEGFPKDWLPPLSEVTQQRSADLQSVLQPFALAAGAWGGKRL